MFRNLNGIFEVSLYGLTQAYIVSSYTFFFETTVKLANLTPTYRLCLYWIM